MNNLVEILEGILFISGDGVEKNWIAEKLNISLDDIEKAIKKLQEKYSKECGIHLLTYKDKIQFCSNPKYADNISVVLNPIREKQLSKSTLETISIICYKQPITRLEIEEIRKVNSDYALQTLLKHNLIEVVGRKDALGKPLLFGTTDEFLKRFNLSSISDLPDYNDIMKTIEVFEQNDSLYNNFEIPDEEKSEKIEQNESENSENASLELENQNGNNVLAENKKLESENINLAENNKTNLNEQTEKDNLTESKKIFQNSNENVTDSDIDLDAELTDENAQKIIKNYNK